MCSSSRVQREAKSQAGDLWRWNLIKLNHVHSGNQRRAQRTEDMLVQTITTLRKQNQLKLAEIKENILANVTTNCKDKSVMVWSRNSNSITSYVLFTIVYAYELHLPLSRFGLSFPIVKFIIMNLLNSQQSQQKSHCNLMALLVFWVVYPVAKTKNMEGYDWPAPSPVPSLEWRVGSTPSGAWMGMGDAWVLPHINTYSTVEAQLKPETRSLEVARDVKDHWATWPLAT